MILRFFKNRKNTIQGLEKLGILSVVKEPDGFVTFDNGVTSVTVPTAKAYEFVDDILQGISNPKNPLPKPECFKSNPGAQAQAENDCARCPVCNNCLKG